MGRTSSPLRDRVIFLEGAPRSGTTWLVTVLATHPSIAGTQAESHLFDFGVDRLFDNLEHRDTDLHGLDRYMERDQLVDLTRDLCDGVFMAMRTHVAGPEQPSFVVEKTPHGSRPDGLDLQRKLDCYPDAWYVHLVREREAVISSLMRAPFMPDRSYQACAEFRDRSVTTIRSRLADAPRYREVSYEQLRADPGAECRELFGWIGVAAGEEELAMVRRLSRERFSDVGATSAASRMTSMQALRQRALDRARRTLASSAPAAPEGSRLVFALAEALRKRDISKLSEITHPDLEYEYRSAEGDQLLKGDAARAALVQLADDVFHRRHVGEWWASAGGPGEWFSHAAGKPFWTLFFSRVGSDGSRVDLAAGLMVEGDRIRRLVFISAGPLTGRRMV